MPKELTEQDKEKIDKVIDSLYLDVQGTPVSGTSLTQEYIIKLLTRLVMSVCTIVWSVSELVEYIRNRREFREFVHQ